MLHIFCALPCEASPIIQHFKLTELKPCDLFRLYQSKDRDISLMITGPGKLNTAAAVTYHHARIGTQPADCWLNIGVAGHKTIPVGEARLINKITDKQSNATWYPQIIFKHNVSCAALITLDKPSATYQSSLFDMEASAFYQMAIRLGTAEMIHCLKVISDNASQTMSSVNASDVKQMITAQLETINDLVENLRTFSHELALINAEPEHYQTIIEQWHFTQSERRQLFRLLRQWTTRFSDQEVLSTIDRHKTAQAIIRTLEDQMKNTDFVIHD